MSCWQIILEFIKVTFDLVKGIAWPTGLIVFAYYFKSDISTAIPRIRKAGVGGVEFDSVVQQQSAVTLSHQQYDLGATTPTISGLENKIKSDIDSRTTESQVPLLTRQLAIYQAMAFFENTYGMIFGTQIEALEQLTERGPISVTEARQFFDHSVKPKFDNAGIPKTFEEWSHFLVVKEFVSIEADQVSIKELGKEFLLFLKSRNMSLLKPL